MDILAVSDDLGEPGGKSVCPLIWTGMMSVKFDR
jgi:hypothetical protein